ncbi:MAG: hypothetical protein ABR570_12405 [Burkholderiales bacterium]
MNKPPPPAVLPRGRIAKWTKEQLDRLSTPELRTLLDNAARLNEHEVVTLCNALLDARPRGRVAVRRRANGEFKGFVSRAKAFQLHGVTPRSRVWSRGGVRSDGGVMLALRIEDVQRSGAANVCLLWAPNIDNARPWSDSPAGQERLEHCRLALERGVAEGVLAYGGEATDAASERIGGKAERVDAENVLKLEVESREGEYWARWTSGTSKV